MDFIQIGKRIESRRNALGLSREKLSAQLGVTLITLCEWEEGIKLPDSKLIPKLCRLLQITPNELFLFPSPKPLDGQIQFLQNKLKATTKLLLSMEWVIIGLATAGCLFLFIPSAQGLDEGTMPSANAIGMMVIACVLLLVGVVASLKIEQQAGSYECRHCASRHVPTLSMVLWAPHMGRTRYMRCPKCGKKSWQHKKMD